MAGGQETAPPEVAGAERLRAYWTTGPGGTQPATHAKGGG